MIIIMIKIKNLRMKSDLLLAKFNNNIIQQNRTQPESESRQPRQ